jgi:membrane protein DedA with SNARE-associated domain
METLRVLLEAHGYSLLFAVGVLEFGGVPIASLLLLALAGSFAAEGTLGLPGAVLSAAAGGLVADAAWYGLARQNGERILAVACGLATEPGACILGVQARVAKIGVRALVFGKLLPGVGNLTAPAAGLTHIGFGRFLLGDGAGLLLWALTGTLLGWIFTDQVEVVVRTLANSARAVLALALALVAFAALLRVVKVRRHRVAHHDERPNRTTKRSTA